jgi:RNA polymerase sigma-70 factor (ECF subfamily)
MSSGGHLPDDPHADRTILGDLLYADRAEPLREQDWVVLVRSIAGGDQRALRALYDRTHRLVFTLSMRITGARETAEEVTLDVYHDVWRRASSYDAENGSVVGWIMNQARSRAIDRLRFEQRKKRTRPLGEVPISAGETPGPHEALELEERGARVRDALRSLTTDERLAIETAFFGELTYVEAAERLRQPVGTVKTRIRSGLTKLRQALDGN